MSKQPEGDATQAGVVKLARNTLRIDVPEE